MVAISVAVDRKQALLAGHDLGDWVTVDVSSETIGADLWPILVDRLNTQYTPPVLGSVMIAAPTAEAVRTAIASEAERVKTGNDKQFQALRDGVAALRAAIAAPAVTTEKRVFDGYSGTDVSMSAKYAGIGRTLPYVPIYASNSAALTAEQRAECDALVAERDVLVAQSNAEINAYNAAALEAALPALREAYIREVAERAAADEREEREKAERLAARAKARLESGYWERETASYNDRRYGAPWCAKVTGIKPRGELVYEWGDSTARHGAAGLLRVVCKPGDIIAWGQKDLRKPGSSDHHILVMSDDGTMQTIDRTDAYRRLTA